MKEKEGKKKVNVKVGIWVNRFKLRKALDRFSLFYGFALTFMALLQFIQGDTLMWVMCIGLAFPLWIIQYSKIKFDKVKDFIE